MFAHILHTTSEKDMPIHVFIATEQVSVSLAEPLGHHSL
jgi:hypothetical protein